MPGETAVVCAEDLCRNYGRLPVLRGVSLSLPAGGCLAILGENGAGKSTLLRILAGALRPRRGWIRICGEDPFTMPSARRRVGFVGHEPMLYGGLSVAENLYLIATLYDLADDPARVAETCALLGIDRPGALVRSLSRGMRQRAALARALIHRPVALLLDEPFTGLDPRGADDLCRILNEFRREGGAIVLATHSASEALRVAGEAAVLAGGRVAARRALGGADAEGLRSWFAEATGGGMP